MSNSLVFHSTEAVQPPKMTPLPFCQISSGTWLTLTTHEMRFSLSGLMVAQNPENPSLPPSAATKSGGGHSPRSSQGSASSRKILPHLSVSETALVAVSDLRDYSSLEGRSFSEKGGTWRKRDLDSTADRRSKPSQEVQETLPSTGVSRFSLEDLQERKFQGFP